MTEIRNAQGAGDVWIEIVPNGRRALRMPGNRERLVTLKASMGRRNMAEALFPDNGRWSGVELAKRRETWKLFSATGQKRGNLQSIVEQLSTVMAEPVDWVEEVLLEARQGHVESI